ncbi:MAG: dihydrodipicolinate synthase family protein [Promethearchaeota archaeon]|jgi:dihydrodipicolinate synthase/N-acetylneuraminate lyase/aminoglycoside phosphotransferase (APT) family kinase protein
MPQINGVICNALTFFNSGGEIIKNLNSLLIRHILTNDVNNLLLFGSIGEGRLFSNKIDEKIKLIDIAMELTEKKNPILVGIYGNTADDIIEQIENLAKKHDEISFMITPPISEKISSDAVESYFENILGSVNPKNQIYLYNNPLQCARNEIDPNWLKNLTQFPTLRGLNDSFYNIRICKSYLELLNDNFSVFCGLEENSQNFFQLIPLNLRKYSGIVSSISNLVNLSSKLYYYALNDNLLEILQTQEQVNDIRSKIYNIKIPEGKEQRGLKYAFLHLYKDLISKDNEEVNYISSTLQNEIDPISRERIEATVNSLLNSKQIYKLYSIGKKDLYQFQDIIKTFSQIDVLVQQGKVKKITGPYIADVNTIYKVKFENTKLVFRFRTNKFFQFENLVKQKLLFPFLDKNLTPNDQNLREKVKDIINNKTGSYIFDKEKPPVIPVSNLRYYDETKKIVPFIFSAQDYIRGKPLFQLINKYINEGKNLNTKKFVILFENLGNHLGNLHSIKFDSFSKYISNIGASKKTTYGDFIRSDFEREMQEVKKNKIDFGNDIRGYFEDNFTLIEEENEFVLLHNDFHSQNIIVKEDQGIIHINGLVDFDNWCVGSRAQDFIKIDFFILKPLNISSFTNAFYDAYSKFYNVNADFRKKIEIYKLLWLLNKYNFESEFKRKVDQDKFPGFELSSLDNYLFEIKAILR